MRDPSPTCTRSSAHRSPGGLIISDRPSSDITRPDAGKAQACQQESSILQQPCWVGDGPAPANRNAVCLHNASIGPALACRRGCIYDGIRQILTLVIPICNRVANFRHKFLSCSRLLVCVGE